MTLDEKTGFYSDGDENELYLLEIAQKYPEDLSADYVENKNHYLLDHTFSDVRQNLLNWYPFRKDAELLEIGAGMGALTGLFCDRCKTVTALEMSARRTDIIRARYKKRNNLSIVNADINNWDTNKRFDYIVFVGVLEYAAAFSSSPDPFVEFLRNSSKLLNDGGIILLAIENRFGLKYWCGAAEDHLRLPFVGIQGYCHNKSPETFSKKALQNMLKGVGLNALRFYYPLPDYKFPSAVFSDDYLPDHKDLKEMKFLYYYTSLLTANEQNLYREIIENNTFGFFANSFLVEASFFQLPKRHVIFASCRDKIKKQYRVTTSITSDGIVTKFPFSSHAAAHIENIRANNEYLKGRGVDVVDAELHDNSLISLRYQGLRADKVFEQHLIANDFKSLCSLIDALAECLKKSSDPSKDSSCPEIILERGFIDMTFSNCFFSNFKFIFFDQEFVFPNVPLKYILFLAIRQSYYRSNVKTQIQFSTLLGYIDITPSELVLYHQLAEKIATEILGDQHDEYSKEKYYNLFSDELTLNQEQKRVYEAFEQFSQNEKQLAEKIKTLNDEIMRKNFEIEELKRNSFAGIEADAFSKRKVLAVFLDDVVNNFSEIMNENGIIFNRRIHSFNDQLLKNIIYNMATGELTEIGKRIMLSTRALAGIADILICLRENGWEIIICTDRDLRFSLDVTKRWLDNNHIPYSCLFQTDDLVGMCRKLNINYLVSDKPILEEGNVGINYQTINRSGYKNNKIKFGSIEEVNIWIVERTCLMNSFHH
ncbi:class I SAM-dependent methyltransferase [Desulfosporosinus sp. PR]|uniref:class I SAM-dependent methyltransferase n=1 Tax=Candidatus Desulfosporosinus nitrosoreducens TaxID=3401928 RepID=UPI0027FFEF76|nr:class I SAM-dependent methyltransferase [Desulfosporosinus sp. PR]MDQ7092013.1 class I SAM-dependent methyltransferase [Desulfosporosinus sp. PR]